MTSGFKFTEDQFDNCFFWEGHPGVLENTVSDRKQVLFTVFLMNEWGEIEHMNNSDSEELWLNQTGLNFYL